MQTLTPGKSHDQIKPALKSYNARCEALGVDEPKVVFTDNITDRTVLEECIPALANGVVTALPENTRRLPPASLEGVETIYVTSLTELDTHVSLTLLPLLESCTPNTPLVAALDTEWPTDSNYQKREQDKVATVQISPADLTLVYVFNVYALTDGFKSPLPDPLRLVLEHESVRFVGSRVSIDVRHLKEDWDMDIKNHINATCNLAMVCKAAGWPVNGNASLQKLAEVLLGVRVFFLFFFLSFFFIFALPVSSHLNAF